MLSWGGMGLEKESNEEARIDEERRAFSKRRRSVAGNEDRDTLWRIDDAADGRSNREGSCVDTWVLL